MLADNVDKLAQDVACAVRAEVDFYKSTRVVTDDDLLASCADNLRIALNSLQEGAAFDTSPAVATGSRRAAAVQAGWIADPRPSGRRRARVDQPGPDGAEVRGLGDRRRPRRP